MLRLSRRLPITAIVGQRIVVLRLAARARMTQSQFKKITAYTYGDSLILDIGARNGATDL
jgi:hypothetical protein